MKIILTLILLNPLISLHPDPSTCTKDFQPITNTLFDIVISFEKDYGHPDAQSFKNLLGEIQTFLYECVSIDVNLSKYEGCVDYVMPIFPDIKDLIENARSMKTIDIIIDVSDILLNIVHSVSKCMKL